MNFILQTDSRIAFSSLSKMNCKKQLYCLSDLYVLSAAYINHVLLHDHRYNTVSITQTLLLFLLMVKPHNRFSDSYEHQKKIA